MRVVKVVALTLVGAIVLWSAAYVVAKWRFERAVREVTTGMAPAGATRTNAAAQRIMTASQAVGIPLVMREPFSETASSFNVPPDLRQDAATWVNEQIVSSAPLAPPPPSVSEWLAREADALNRLDEAIDSGTPVWHSDPTSPALQSSAPSLVAHIAIVKLYAARALEAERTGREAEAWSSLERAKKLSDGLWHRADLMSNMIALAETKLIAQTSTRLTDPAPSWMSELTSTQPGEPFRRSLTEQARAFPALLQQDPGSTPRPPGVPSQPRISRAVLLPVEYWQVLALVEHHAAIIHRLGEECSAPPPARAAAKISRLGETVTSVRIARQQLELARLVHAARAGETLAPRAICGRSWQVERSGDGSIVLRLPADAPRPRLGVDIRELRLPAAELPSSRSEQRPTADGVTE